MPVQLSLFDPIALLQAPPSQPPSSPNKRRLPAGGGGPRGPARGDHNIFFGAVPSPRVRDEIELRYRSLSEAFGLGQPLKRSTLHANIYGLGFMRTLDMRFVDAFRTAADLVPFAPFDLTFTHTSSFGGGAFVLTTDEARCEPLQDLAEALRVSLSEAGLKVPPKLQTIKPHITLTYTSKLPERPIEPLKWTVTSFSLIDSIYGYGKHDPLGRWPR